MKVSFATLVLVMRLDAKEGLTSFDDGPELVKHQGWYDQVREDAGNSSHDGKIEEGDGWLSTELRDARKAS